jgi:hypothetical protein
MSEHSDAKSSGLVLYTTVPVNLFRMGNASGPRLDNVRDQDVPSETVGEGKAAVRMVRPDGGISTFDGIDKSLADRKWWCIPADIMLPDTIRLVRDKRNPKTGLTHYSIRPARYMTMLEFADGLKAQATKAKLVFTGVSSDAKSRSK